VHQFHFPDNDTRIDALDAADLDTSVTDLEAADLDIRITTLGAAVGMNNKNGVVL
jgi:hypothetical protein